MLKKQISKKCAHNSLERCHKDPRPWRNWNSVGECSPIPGYILRSVAISCRAQASQASRWPAVRCLMLRKVGKKAVPATRTGIYSTRQLLRGSHSVGLSWEWFCSLWLIWQRLQTFWLSQLGGASGIRWVETRQAAQHSTLHRTVPPHQRADWPRMSMVPSLRNSGLALNSSC